MAEIIDQNHDDTDDKLAQLAETYITLSEPHSGIASSEENQPETLDDLQPFPETSSPSNGVMFTKETHRIIAMEFIENPYDGSVCRVRVKLVDRSEADTKKAGTGADSPPAQPAEHDKDDLSDNTFSGQDARYSDEIFSTANIRERYKEEEDSHRLLEPGYQSIWMIRHEQEIKYTLDDIIRNIIREYERQIKTADSLDAEIVEKLEEAKKVREATCMLNEPLKNPRNHSETQLTWLQEHGYMSKWFVEKLQLAEYRLLAERARREVERNRTYRLEYFIDESFTDEESTDEEITEDHGKEDSPTDIHISPPDIVDEERFDLTDEREMLGFVEFGIVPAKTALSYLVMRTLAEQPTETAGTSFPSTTDESRTDYPGQDATAQARLDWLVQKNVICRDTAARLAVVVEEEDRTEAIKERQRWEEENPRPFDWAYEIWPDYDGDDGASSKDAAFYLAVVLHTERKLGKEAVTEEEDEDATQVDPSLDFSEGADVYVVDIEEYDQQVSRELIMEWLVATKQTSEETSKWFLEHCEAEEEREK